MVATQKRQFDLVIFGASGFTGQHIVLATARLCRGLKWAIAGRSEEKLSSVLKLLPTNEHPEIIKADVNDEASLKAMTAKTRLLINAVGPYRTFGEPIVKACVETSTSLVDLCGEPEFLERVEFKYHEAAVNAGCLIVESCGFDSIPADLGVVKLAQRFEPNGVMTKAELFLTVKGGEKGAAVHYTTYEAAVLGFGSGDDLRKLRAEASSSKPKLNSLGPKPQAKAIPFRDERIPDRSCYLFMGSDASVIRRTQEQMTKANSGHVSPHVGVYFTIEDGVMNNTKMMVYGGTFQFLAKYQFGRNLLLKYPTMFSNGIFSHEGPTEDQMKETTFEMTIFGSGYSDKSKLASAAADKQQPFPLPDRQMTLKIKGPEPGYKATSSMVTLAALCILKSQDETDNALPCSGVFTPGFVFRSCRSLMEGMANEGITFEFVEEKNEEGTKRNSAIEEFN